MSQTKLERIVKFYPAFDKRDPDPAKNYGIHGVELLMAVKGPKGVVQFKLYTNWQLPHIQEEMLNKPVRDRTTAMWRFLPMPTDLGYHSYVPHYEDQSCITDACELLDGKPCYYDGSGLNAEPVFKLLVEKGDEAVWRKLERYYEVTFNSDETAQEDRND